VHVDQAINVTEDTGNVSFELWNGAAWISTDTTVAVGPNAVSVAAASSSCTLWRMLTPETTFAPVVPPWAVPQSGGVT
jgi:hypothetical protein